MTLSKTEKELSKKVGLKSIPESTSILELKILEIFSENPKDIFTSKSILEILKQKDKKFFSDKLWNLRKNNKILNVGRGFYKSRN